MYNRKKMSLTGKSITLAATALAIFITSPMPVYAQGKLEEVVVTARKREESLQDVPISVQAISGNQIAVQGITDIQALAPYTPNFSYTPAPGASDLYFMRGLGTFGSGAHFEPSVGQVFNGFFSTRSRLGRSALVDVQRVEVLKGPQGPVIGKNTSLGAINIAPNKPTREFEAELATQYNFEASEGFEVDGFISGPLHDRVRGRIAVNYRDTDGWVHNQVTGDDLQKSEDLTVRGILEVDITDNVSAELFYQKTDFERQGKARVVFGCQEFDPGVVNGVSQGGTPGPAGGLFTIAGTAALGFDCNGLDAANDTANIVRNEPGGEPFNSLEPFTLNSDLFGLTVDMDFNDFTVTSVTSWTTYEIMDVFSGDQTDFERVDIRNNEKFDQFYQELRVASNTPAFGGALDYMAGVMFFSGELDFYQTFNAIAGAVGPPVPPINPAVSRNEFAASETDSQAAFAQFDWHATEAITLTLGGRFTHESRSGSKAQQVGEIWTRDLTAAPIPCDTPTSPLSACTHGNDGLQPGGTPITGSIDENNLSYNASIRYALNDDNIFYFTNSTGFKSGGFDLRGAGDPDAFIFPEEETTNYEFGGKHTLFNGSLRVNWTLYRTEVENLQVSANDPIIIQQIVASADATSEGVELDMSWAPTDGLLLTFAGAYTDAKYDRFIGSCYLGQPETGTGCMNVTFAQGALQGVQDLSGEQMVLAPEWSWVLGGQYTMPIGGTMELTTSAKWIYVDDQFTSIERDPLAFSNATNRIDASITLSGRFNGGHPWTLSLVGRNLNDELVPVFSNSTTLSGGAIMATNIEETRSISLRGSIGW